MKHDLAVIVLGTEDSVERGRVLGLLAKYALEAFYTSDDKTEITVHSQDMSMRNKSLDNYSAGVII